MFVAAADSHTAIIGGTGAIGIPFGFETSLILATGKTWIRVPRTIKIVLEGHAASRRHRARHRAGDHEPAFRQRRRAIASSNFTGPRWHDCRSGSA